MKVMVMIKSVGADEGKVTPTPEVFEAMTAYNERLAKAGILLDGAGLRPSSAGAKVIMEGGTTSVVDGPFTEAKEIIGGYWIWQVNSLEEAIEWASSAPATGRGRADPEIRPYAEAETSAAHLEIRERESGSPKRSKPATARTPDDTDGKEAAWTRRTAEVFKDAPARLVASSPGWYKISRWRRRRAGRLPFALEQWPQKGVPDDPAAWLMTGAAGDRPIRRERSRTGAPSSRPSSRPG